MIQELSPLKMCCTGQGSEGQTLSSWHDLISSEMTSGIEGVLATNLPEPTNKMNNLNINEKKVDMKRSKGVRISS
jgi:hypothetical protein